MYDKKLYSMSEAAYYLGISLTTLKKWEELGKIISVKKPNSSQKFFPQEQVNKLMSKLKDRTFMSRTSIR